MNVISSGEILRIASYVDISFLLVDADVVHPHTGWESQVFEVNFTEVLGHAQVDDNILEQV